MRTLWSWFIAALITLAAMEIALRTQDALGPIYDLSLASVSLEALSDSLNHKPSPKNEHVLVDQAVYGEYTGTAYSQYYSPDGIRINGQRALASSYKNPIKILVLGDSFMQGYDDNNTVPQKVWRRLKSKGFQTQIYNAANSSYSTLIYIVQAKSLIPKLRPDFVVVAIDETDLGDDYLRYKDLVVRDADNRVKAVQSSPILKEFLSGLVEIKSEPLYILRLARKLYHTKVHMPAFTARHMGDSRHVLGFSWDDSENPYEKFRREVEYFDSNVRELLEILVTLMGGTQRILIVYHPHLRHLSPAEHGGYWNELVSSTVARISAEYGVHLANMTDDFAERFKDRPENYYWPGDMHFNFEGMEIYGETLGDVLHDQLIEAGYTPVK